MTVANYPVYDADRHFYEPPEAFLRHLPKKFQKEFQYVEVNGRTKLAVAGVLSDYIPNPTFEVVAAPGSHEKWYRGQNPEGLSLRECTGAPVPSQAAFHSGDAHLKVMDEQRIHAGLFIPTLASIIEERLAHKPDVIHALLQSVNRWTADECGFAHQGRLFPVPMINLSNVDAACEELDYLLAAGARVVGIRPAPVTGLTGGRSMGFEEFDPFWARINEAKIFVVMHVSDSGYDKIYQWWTAGGKGEFRPFEKDPFGEILDWMGRPIADSLGALICHGVFDRFPNVRVASLENGSGWLEPLLHRLNMTYHKMPKAFRRHPVETFRQHVYVAPFYEDPVEKVIELIGVERVLFGSDWPHPEGLAHPLDFFKDIESLSAEQTQRVMSTNLKELLEGVR
ncbi:MULTISPECIES: amidohydrolase family protein [Pandoraea]|uniref:Amidohydrolase n=2 Tax=Pandoraea TaxID=93217 RepID=A0AAW7MHF1_9BURK|nr:MULTISPECIES: amidohydrolase family protein [Pandoraea]ALS65179.1 amidohydrolase [Pandoraea apista]MDN4572063.1 amidohydrolase [Pandoraea cepalis]MDN4576719.1 amidohydrolase [Pandoraea cepalis]QHE91537.1 amidohydrolase family protein [Pandoraea fibrosis]QHF14905.1 amidohydrolase family protein [Pandoraea fibrosis]